MSFDYGMKSSYRAEKTKNGVLEISIWEIVDTIEEIDCGFRILDSGSNRIWERKDVILNKLNGLRTNTR